MVSSKSRADSSAVKAGSRSEFEILNSENTVKHVPACAEYPYQDCKNLRQHPLTFGRVDEVEEGR